MPRSVCDVLRDFALIEWGGKSTPDGAYEQGVCLVPRSIWRFHPGVDAARRQQVVEAIESYRGSVDWYFEQGPRNWVLIPRALQTYAAQMTQDGPVKGGLSAIMVSFSKAYPELSQRAIEDSESLARHVEELLGE